MVELCRLIKDALIGGAPRGSQEQERNPLVIEKLLRHRLPRAVCRGEVILRLVVRQTAVLTRLDEGPATVGKVRSVKGLRRTILLIYVGRRPEECLLQGLFFADDGLAQVGADTVGAEVSIGQMAVVLHHKEDNPHHG